MPRKNDYAILVGVADYPVAKYTRLKGPLHDVAYFRKWLLDPAGGDMDEANIRELVSPNPTIEAHKDYPPTEVNFWEVLQDIVFVKDQPMRRDGRLYLYFSGHGFSGFADKRHHAALYMGNAGAALPVNVCGTFAAEWCRRAAVFKEIILIMDCCRDEQLQKQPWLERFADIHDPVLANKVRTLYIYAAPYDRKAHEAYIASEEVTLGLLTYALITALRSAPLESNGKRRPAKRSSHAVKTFLNGSWASIVGEIGMDPPDFDTHNDEEIVFSYTPPQKIKRTIRFSPLLDEEATIRIINDPGDTVYEAQLNPVTQTAHVHVPGEGVVASPFDGGTLEVMLDPEVHELILQRVSQPDLTCIVNVLGAADVVVNA